MGNERQPQGGNQHDTPDVEKDSQQEEGKNESSGCGGNEHKNLVDDGGSSSTKRKIEHSCSDLPSSCITLPTWVEASKERWGDRLHVPEWCDFDSAPSSYRSKNGWKGSDLMHAADSPVRILAYWALCSNSLDNDNQDENTNQASSLRKTTLTGVVHFSPKAESHKGFCHGGAACAVMDDVIGWCGFLSAAASSSSANDEAEHDNIHQEEEVYAGRMHLPHRWCGYTVQINTSLKKPIEVNSILVVQAVVSKKEGRKVFVNAKLVGKKDHGGGEDEVVHALGDGLFLLNRSFVEKENKSK